MTGGGGGGACYGNQHTDVNKLLSLVQNYAHTPTHLHENILCVENMIETVPYGCVLVCCLSIVCPCA